jgi:hypothetical protein
MPTTFEFLISLSEGWRRDVYNFPMSANENLDLTNIDETTTVEEYLKQQCNQQIDRLRRHSDDLVRQFQTEAAEVRQKLVHRLAPSMQPPQ